jgi:aspartyl-tRNA(Asn)/glutamyl-tRNA(Gln) amidotransferase subunit B
MVYLEVSDCNMQEGSLRCDANINLEVTNPAGEAVRTPIVEVKNLNSFRGVEAALTYEIARQEKEFDECDGVYPDDSKQTRGWDADRGVTFAQRGKEDASDYRYFPDPDLLPVTFSDEYIAELRDGLCEPPAQRRRRFVQQLGLSDYDAAVLIDQGPQTADYFESVARQCQDAKRAANWVTQDVLRELNERDQAIDDFALDADGLATLIGLITSQELTTRSGREVFAVLVEGGGGEGTVAERIDRIVQQRGLAAVADTAQLDQLIDTVIAGNQQAAEDFRDGKDAAIGKLIGEVMREAGGADPQKVREALIAKLRS